MNWQPIATAPKDGREILLCQATNDSGERITAWGLFIQVAAWWADEDDETGEDKDSGEWVVYCSMLSEPRLHFTPTHWAELPEPPS